MLVFMRLLLLAALILVTTPAMAAPPDTTTFDLGALQWKNRVLLVFAPSHKAPGYEKQMQLFEAAPDEAFAERDLVTVTLFATGRGRADGQPIRAEAVQRLRARFGVSADQFALVLVGKDGTEKRRDTAPVKPEAIFDVIDAMPMRQREMERQREGGSGP